MTPDPKPPVPPPCALSLTDARAYVGGVSASQFWRITRRYGKEPNVFGTWPIATLDELNAIRQARTRKRKQKQ